MFKKIFRSSFVTCIIICLISIILISVVLFNYFENKMFDELKTEVKYISFAISDDETSFFNNFNDNEKRITYIKSDGTVIFDTVADTTKLDNHKNRTEVKEALKTGYGKSARYSDTLTQRTLYYAIKLDNGNVLRVSTNQFVVVSLLMGLKNALILILILILIIAWIFSYHISKKIINPINKIDIDNPKNNDTYEELSPLLRKIDVQKQTINMQIEEALRKQNEFNLITENMTEGFLVIDKDAEILTYNSSALKLLNINDVNKSSVLTFNRSKQFREIIKNVLLGIKKECEMNFNDKTYILLANPVMENNKVIGGVIIIFDTTEKSQREALRREFASNVSHELKTPLTSISGFAELMKEGNVSKELVVDFSNSIYEEAQRLITLVSDIMKLSQLDEQKNDVEKEYVDIYELSKSILDRLTPIANKKNILISLDGEKTVIMGNRKILEDMIYNLCDNAIKYNKDDGKINVLVKNNKIIVEDTGIGIPFDKQERVFERFYRVDKSHSKKIDGTGLGLSIVKHAAIFHDAVINLESKENVGTKITVEFK